MSSSSNKGHLRLRLLKAIVFALGIVLLYHNTLGKQQFLDIFIELREGRIEMEYGWLLFAVVILFINWGLETAKWRRLINEFAHPTFFVAFKAILSGVFVSFFTPNRVGEFAGRIIYLKEKRIEASLLTVAGSFSQNICTFLFGCLAVLFFYASDPILWSIGISILLALASGILFFYFNIDRLTVLLRILGLKRKWLKYFIPIRHLTNRQLSMVLFYSFLRHLAFNLQFLVMFEALRVPISFGDAVLGINLLFLIQNSLPSIAFLELGTRGIATEYAFAVPQQYQGLLLIASYGVWFINVFLPGLLGAFLFLLNRREDVDI